MSETKVKVWSWVNVKIAREVWREAKIEATRTDERLSDWIAEAIIEKLSREKGSRV
jgi:hypothetical protein